MFYLVGLGLGDVKDITVKGLETIKTCKTVFLESYTSIITGGKEALEEYYGKEIIVADRDMVEQESDLILKDSLTQDVAFLVVGDPFGATTHTDLVLRAKQANIPFKVIHNASIMNAVGCCGLQLYNYGETVSIVFWTDTWKPDSFYDKINANRKRGLHTLCLLDIKVKEPTDESLTKKKKIYQPPRFMTAGQAADQLIQIIKKKQDEGLQDLAYEEDTLAVGLARVGCDDQNIVCCSLKEMVSTELGPPLHSLVIAGDLHPLEIDMLKLFTSNIEWFQNTTKNYQL